MLSGVTPSESHALCTELTVRWLFKSRSSRTGWANTCSASYHLQITLLWPLYTQLC